MSTALQTKGLKRICKECSTRFYDLNKRPIICPNCNAEFIGEVKTKGRKGRGAANDDKGQVSKKTAKEKPGRNEAEEDEDAEAEGDDDLVSLDEVEDLENEDIDDEFEVDLELGDEDIDLDEDDLDDIGNLDDLDIDEDEDISGDADED